MPVRPPLLRRASAALALTCSGLCATPAALAWDASVTLPNLGVDFVVSSWSGSWTWDTLREGVSTAYDLNGTIPIDFQFQDWNGRQWNDAYFYNEVVLPTGASAKAYLDRSDTTLPMADYAEAFVTGPLGNASAGSHVVYDFSFTLAPFSQATLTYYDDAAYVSVASGPGEQGAAFAGLKLYDFAADIDAPGGANQPYFDRYVVAFMPDTRVDDTLAGMSYTFSNFTAAPVSHALRLEGYALVFTTPVPEPATPALLMAGLGILGWVARRRLTGVRA